MALLGIGRGVCVSVAEAEVYISSYPRGEMVSELVFCIWRGSIMPLLGRRR